MATKSQLKRQSAMGIVKREDGVLEHAWPAGEEDRLHKLWIDGTWYVARYRWMPKADGSWVGARRGDTMNLQALAKLLAS